MIDPATAALALAIALVALPVLTGPFESRFLRADPPTAPKLAYYGATFAGLWGLTIAAAWIEGVARLRDASWPWSAWLPFAAVAGPVIGVLVAAYLLLALMPLLQSLRGPRLRSAYASAFRRHAASFPGLLPNTAAERFGFAALSLTAGVCEEALFRGFLIRFLHEGAPALPLALALAVAAIPFALGHIYQGVSGVIKTGLAGLIFGLLFLLSGSLIPGIILHALVDLQVVYVLRPLPKAAEAAA
jgi:membrane protease YdiL (CAAX protease family)